RKELKQRGDELRSVHKKIGLAMKNISSGQAQIEIDEVKQDEIRQKGKKQKEEIKKIETELEKVEKEFNSLMLKLPNITQEDVPVGKDDTENIVLRKVGKKPKFDFEPKDYLDIAQELDLIDVKRAAKIAGTRFGYLKGEAALLEFALVQLAFDIIMKEGFEPIVPPVMIKTEMALGMGYIEQTTDEDAYYLPKDDLYLVGTSEQSIGAMHAGETFNEKDLPKRYVGFSTCFRREAGSYGKDTKGIFRVHQFDKVEMFSFCHPDNSKKEHELLLSLEEKLMQKLGLHYQVVNICTGDLGLPAFKKYDIEVWIPSQKRYRETHSTSNCTDFQSRRLNIRYKDKTGKSNFIHTLNGTAFAVGRMIIAIIENFQQKDGSIKVPEVLQEYLGFKIIK
ncbi:serine--tRNA ligase, partial [Patescibacteria group bacterium]